MPATCLAEDDQQPGQQDPETCKLEMHWNSGSRRTGGPA